MFPPASPMTERIRAAWEQRKMETAASAVLYIAPAKIWSLALRFPKLNWRKPTVIVRLQTRFHIFYSGGSYAR